MGKSKLADIPGNFFQERIGSSAALASNGAGAILGDTFWVAPADIKIKAAWKTVTGANEVTAGTAISSASYRRFTLVNGSTDGTGTVIVASLNPTASAASLTSRAFATTANNTVASGNLIFVSHLTVGAATADGTDAAIAQYHIQYELL